MRRSTVLFGRFIALLRTWAVVIAGAAGVSFRKFVTYNTIGSIVWAIVFGSLGYYFGRDLPLLERYSSHASFEVLFTVAIGVVVFVVVKERSGSSNGPA